MNHKPCFAQPGPKTTVFFWAEPCFDDLNTDQILRLGTYPKSLNNILFWDEVSLVNEPFELSGGSYKLRVNINCTN